jgi:hypothetical protein
MSIAGLGDLILNEQFLDDSPGHAGITVNALHLTVPTPAGAPLDIIIGQAHADATFPGA